MKKKRVTMHEVLVLLKEGKSAREIAQILDTKIGNVRAHRTRIVKSNLWHPKDSGLQWTLDLDQATELLIDRLEKARSVPELLSRISTLEAQKNTLESELVLLRKDIEAKLDRERRYKQAVQQGTINPPISSRK